MKKLTINDLNVGDVFEYTWVEGNGHKTTIVGIIEEITGKKILVQDIWIEGDAHLETTPFDISLEINEVQDIKVLFNNLPVIEILKEKHPEYFL